MLDLWIFGPSATAKKMTRIRRACEAYRTAFFASPVNAKGLNTALVEMVRIAYEVSLNQPFPGLTPTQQRTLLDE